MPTGGMGGEDTEDATLREVLLAGGYAAGIAQLAHTSSVLPVVAPVEGGGTIGVSGSF